MTLLTYLPFHVRGGYAWYDSVAIVYKQYIDYYCCLQSVDSTASKVLYSCSNLA